VDRPFALSGLAGTMMSQFTLATVVTGGGATDALADAEALAHWPAGAVGPLDGPADAEALAPALTHDPRADWSIVVAPLFETARMIPRVKPNAIGMARGTAMRAARLFLLRRRHADRCPLSIQSTSMDVRCDAPGGSR
jgi:hypothetical protein